MLRYSRYDAGLQVVDVGEGRLCDWQGGAGVL